MERLVPPYVATPLPMTDERGYGPGLSPAVPCLFSGCSESVRFDLGSANGNGPTPRAHARCPNGHPHYAEDFVRYGTDRER